MLRNILFASILLISVGVSADDNRIDLSVINIPAELKKDAYAVVRNHNRSFVYHSPTSGTEKNILEITVLDKKGIQHANFSEYGDKFKKLKSFSAKLYDGAGNELKKYKMSDVGMSEWSSNLFSDDKMFYLEIESPSIPYTITYEYETEWKNGIIYFPVFSPQSNYNVSVQHADYKLTVPGNLAIQENRNSLVQPFIQTETKDAKTYIWTVNSLKSIVSEFFTPDIEEFIPRMFVSPKTFIYDNIPGDISTVEKMSEWQNKLNKDRNFLTPETKAKIIELTKNVTTNREKVKILYDYLGQTTRYESINLGIGGFQPIAASEVCKTSFGDCKGLTNYLKAMLEVIQIPSYYTIIRSDEEKKDLSNDFTSYLRTNHIILNVPLPNDTLWLECTNTNVPFGFVHNSISGHKAILVTENDGKIVLLPDYPDSLNLDKSVMHVTLQPNSEAKVSVQKKYGIKVYDKVSSFTKADLKDQTDFLRKEITLPNAQVSEIKFTDDKCSMPNLNINFNWTTPLFGSKTGNRMFIPINAMREGYSGWKKNDRKYDLEINTGWKDVDSICIQLPENYNIEAMPTNQVISSPFGHFQSKIVKDESKIFVYQELSVKSGRWDISQYPEFTSFFDKVTNAYKSKITIKPKAI